MRLRLFLLVMAAMLAFTGGTAQADTGRVSKGEAEAILEAFGNGGWAILRHGEGVVQGAPADGLPDSLAAIRPLPFWNGNHYCALDWHVIVLAIFDGGDASYTPQDFAALRSQVSNTFILDARPFATERTASKRFLRDLTAFGFTTAYYFQDGRVLAPEELAVGTHTLTLIQSFLGETDRVDISFTVDAPGTGACL
jgi:hypothetical protein